MVHLKVWLVYSVLAFLIFVNFKTNLKHGVFSNKWLFLSSTLTPTVLVAAVTLVTPYAWRLPMRGGKFLAFTQRLMIALMFAESSALGIILLDAWFHRRAGFPPPNLHGFILSFLVIVGPAITVAGGLIAARDRAMEEKETMREEALIAKTRLLQSQLHPHVLFNALNGLAELIHKDPPAAELSVMHLADLLRRILSASEHSTFPLGEERELIADFLFIEGMRLGPRLRITWEWDQALDDLQVPPLLFQPLVENAIKHGIAPSRDGGDMVLRVRRDGASLIMEVWNGGSAFNKKPSSGIGLKNLESRLNLHYGSGNILSIQASGEGTLASICLPGVFSLN